MTRAAQGAADAALAIDGIASAAIFLAPEAVSDDGLALGGAAGISGPPLDGLVAAVADPAHPIRRAMGDPEATFDVRPMNPGGPALRSHLPIRKPDGTTLGVVAVAHDRPLGAEARAALTALADGLATNGRTGA